MDYTPTFLSVDENKLSAISVYPNPVKDVLTFDLKNQSGNVDSFEIFDVRGAKVLERKVKSETTTLNVSALNSGIYFVKLIDSSGKNSTVKKIVKE